MNTRFFSFCIDVYKIVTTVNSVVPEAKRP